MKGELPYVSPNTPNIPNTDTNTPVAVKSKESKASTATATSNNGNKEKSGNEHEKDQWTYDVGFYGNLRPRLSRGRMLNSFHHVRGYQRIDMLLVCSSLEE